MGAITSQITSLTVVYWTVYPDADQRKHQSSASLAFVWGIHRGPVNSPHKWPVTRKMFPFDDVIMCASRPNAHGVWHSCCLETFYSNRASDNILEFPSPWIPITPCHQTHSYAHNRQLGSFLDSYDHISTVAIIPPGHLRSCRRCLVCKLRSYHENFTSLYF